MRKKLVTALSAVIILGFIGYYGTTYSQNTPTFLENNSSEEAPGEDSSESASKTVVPESSKMGQVLLRVLKEEGATAAVKLFESWVDSDPEFAYGCHNTAHDLGRAVALAEGPEEVITIAPTLCQSGFLHGVLQVAATDPSISTSICSKLSQQNQDACGHGYGHLLTARFPNSIDAALEVCAKMYVPSQIESSKVVARCGGGAAMEYGLALATYSNIVSAPTDEFLMGPLEVIKVNLPDDQLARPCRVLQEFSKQVADVHHECVSHLGLFYVRNEAASVLDLITACKLSAGLDSGLCLRSVGLRLVEKELNSASPENKNSGFTKVQDICSKMPGPDQASCATGGYIFMLTTELEVASVDCKKVWLTESCSEAKTIIRADRAQ